MPHHNCIGVFLFTAFISHQALFLCLNILLVVYASDSSLKYLNCGPYKLFSTDICNINHHQDLKEHQLMDNSYLWLLDRIQININKH